MFVKVNIKKLKENRISSSPWSRFFTSIIEYFHQNHVRYVRFAIYTGWITLTKSWQSSKIKLFFVILLFFVINLLKLILFFDYVPWLLCIAIYKIKNRGTGNGMRRIPRTRRMFIRIPGNLFEDSGECYYLKIPGNVVEDSGECSRKFRGMLEKIPGNVREGSGESNFRFILWILANFLSNPAIKLRQKKRIIPTLLLTTYNQSPTFKYCFSFTFFLSVFFPLSRKECNYCAQVQGYQETLNNSQLRGLKNTQHRVRTISLKLEN